MVNCLQHAAKNFTSEALSAFAGNLHGKVGEDRADHCHSIFVARRADTCEVLRVGCGSSSTIGCTPANSIAVMTLGMCLAAGLLAKVSSCIFLLQGGAVLLLQCSR